MILALLLAFLLLAGIFFLRPFVTPVIRNLPPPTPTPTPTVGLSLPEFPWPPRASAFMNIPSQYLTNRNGATALKDVGLRLENVLRQCGYGQFGYYAIPGGFALTTRLEQFKADGAPADGPYRWTTDIPNPKVFSFEYLRILLEGKTGHYRVIVFAVTDDSFFAQNEGKVVSAEQADKLAIEGANKLPDSLGNVTYSDRHWCAALIYEFEKPAVDQPVEFKANSSLMAPVHLQKILPYLEKNP
jgi:hypothetical protein